MFQLNIIYIYEFQSLQYKDIPNLQSLCSKRKIDEVYCLKERGTLALLISSNFEMFASLFNIYEPGEL